MGPESPLAVPASRAQPAARPMRALGDATSYSKERSCHVPPQPPARDAPTEMLSSETHAEMLYSKITET